MDAVKRNFLNPITLEANIFLQTLEKFGPQYQFIDRELLCTMDKLCDAINKFYDNSVTRIDETNDVKLVNVKDAECLVRVYNCTRCNRSLGSSVEKAAQHIESVHSNIPRRKKRTASDETNDIKLPKKARTLLSGKLNKVFRIPFKAAEKLKTMPEYALIEEDLLSSLQDLYPNKNIRTCKFGSRISGVGNWESDLDIFVDIDGSFHNYNYRAPTEILDINKRVSNALKKDKKWSEVLPIHNARVPIISLKHVSTKINCDIGFSNSLGYCNTLLMQYFFELQPIAARMRIVIKEWLERTGLTENVSTYSFTLMVIFYMQIKNYLPSVESLQHGLNKPELIGPWICNFQKKSFEELNLIRIDVTKARLREHLQNFFVFYALVEYDKCMICPFKGRLIKFQNIIHELPERFKACSDGSERQVEFQLKKPMVVQDPIELSHNVTKGISKALLKVLVTYFIDSATILSLCEPDKEPLNVLDVKNNNADSSDD